MYQNPYYHPYNPYTNDYLRVQNNTQLVRDIQKAINGEFSAMACYEKLAQMAPNQKERNQILEIREDERRHFEEFTRIYTSLTGRQPTPKMTEECPNTYKRGLEAAFMDEQETVDFYLDIVDKAQDLTIKQAFHRASADEQNHAVWFLYFLTKNRR
ncbi:ferritin-like domain-containing protein [Mesobacillus maritimus]|uniref:ferritin-like domain-containing protein n=1 Tax=Mesobacillus maritimus TaxID=1643336 RepID=UPI00203E94F3|nr:ferritin-like domain-containing protein [Mesobacillus maritimus]MCM3587428.1 ferritin-like domain-containing protein [Mesobacillus maritimus]MCM3667988.1 ferritin-like domain-containing protein [Mesobacillus maritimus]